MSTRTNPGTPPVAAPVAVSWSGETGKVRLSNGSSEASWRYEVLVNGHRIERVWSASVANGEVEQIIVSAHSSVIEDAKLKHPRTRTLRGKVEIRRKARP